MDTDLPFISNTPDDKQCLQASYAMIRQHFDPGLDIAWEDWAEITGYLPGKGTWSMAGLMWFREHGYDVVHLGTFDYGKFAMSGAEYLVEALGEEVASWELQFMDLKIEQARALRFLSTQVWVQKIPSIDDIRDYLNEGYLVKCLVNLNALNDKPGYLGHAVVVKGYTENDIIMHDPGLPPSPNRHVPIDTFLRSWTDPETQSEKMDAIRKLPATSKEQTLITGPTVDVVTAEESTSLAI
ncbi:MAG TPA: hypothetical protein VF572_03440 [Candidatus Saccharimonadales bacterium]|jgi:hypothetical protein